MLIYLSRIHEVLAVSRSNFAQWPSRRFQRAGCAWVRRSIFRPQVLRPDDVTVVIGARNRADHLRRSRPK